MQKDRDSFKRKIDEMQKEVREKTDILCDNEREYHELFLSWERTSEEYKTSKVYFMKICFFTFNLFTLLPRLLGFLEHSVTVTKNFLSKKMTK